MGRCRVVAPETVRLELSDDDFLIVQKRLNAGAARAVLTSLIKEQEFGKPARLDPDKVGLAKMVEYIVDWSLIDSGGKKLPVATTGEREASLKSLDPESFVEILNAVEAHEDRQEVALAERKNGTGGENKSGATSSSVN